MALINFAIVAPDMVWQWYYDELGGKHVLEIIGRDATKFIDDLKMSNGGKDTSLASESKVKRDYYLTEKPARRENVKADGDTRE